MAREPQQAAEQAPTLAEDITPRATPGVPTAQDYQREWQTYRAVTDLVWQGSTAVAAGNPVPVSHPGMRDSSVYGPGWVSQGNVELTGKYDSPGDLRAAHEAHKASQAPQGVPGAGQFPGV